MRLIINSAGFKNSKLPAIASPGFADAFERANANTPGVTSGEGRPWRVFTYQDRPAVWGTNSEGAMVYRSGPGMSLLVADALTPNGRLTATVRSVNAAARAGLAFRVRDVDNCWLMFQASAGSGVSLFKRVNGVQTTVATSTVVPAAGTVLRVDLAGTSIIGRAGSQQLFSVSDGAHLYEEMMGLYGSSDSQYAMWEDITFTP